MFCSILEAEFWTMFFVLRMTEEVNCEKIISESDSLEVVKIMNNNLCVDTDFIELVDMIRAEVYWLFNLIVWFMFLGSQTC